MTSALNGFLSLVYLHLDICSVIYFLPVPAAAHLICFLKIYDIDNLGKDMIEERQSSIEKSYDLLKTLSKERFEILQVCVSFI